MYHKWYGTKLFIYISHLRQGRPVILKKLNTSWDNTKCLTMYNGYFYWKLCTGQWLFSREIR